MHMLRHSTAAMALAAGLVAGPLHAQAQTSAVTGSTEVPGSPDANDPANLVKFVDISGDGTTVIGHARAVAGQSSNLLARTPYVFTRTGTTRLMLPSGYETGIPVGVSNDGTVVAGTIAVPLEANTTRAMTWTNGTASILSIAGGNASQGFALSGNGRVVGGEIFFNDGINPVLWRDGGEPVLLTARGTINPSFITALNDDGSVVAGNLGVLEGGKPVIRAARWTQASGIVQLGTVAEHRNPGAMSTANDISADGLVIVGWSQQGSIEPQNAVTGNNTLAMKWTEAGGMTSLARYTGQVSSVASAVNGDGSVITGEVRVPTKVGAYTIDINSAARWSGGGSAVQTIAEWLAASGVSNGTNTYDTALGVSNDGTVVIGEGNINGRKQGYICLLYTSDAADE